MTRRLLLSYLSITLFVLLVFEVPLGMVFARSERANLLSRVKQDALVLALRSEDGMVAGGAPELQTIAAEYERRAGGRVVITDGDGRALADSNGSGPGADFGNRPEFARALEGRITSGRRSSNTAGGDLLFVAAPVAHEGRIVGVVRITYPASFVDDRIRSAWLSLLGVGLVVLAVVSAVSLRLARSVGRPIRDLERTAAALGAGDLTARAAVPDNPPEVRVLAEAFNATADRLTRLLETQQEFVADASHQLRSPLAALRLRLENLAAEPGVPADEVDSTLAEVGRLSRLVDGLLALARAEQQTGGHERVDVVAVVADRVGAWTALADERGVALQQHIDGPAVVAGTPGHLDQVLDNLIANAIEVAPTGSTVTLRAAPNPPCIDVHVVDEGPGMTDDERERAFDRFWRSSSAGRRGSGLGLAIVRQLVRADGGEVELRRAPTGGIDAVVRLPMA